MTQYNITLEQGLVHNLLMGHGTDEVLKHIMEQFLNQLFESKATDICGAAPYEQSDDRDAYRNGHRDRSLVTRFGKIELSVPSIRDTDNGERDHGDTREVGNQQAGFRHGRVLRPHFIGFEA